MKFFIIKTLEKLVIMILTIIVGLFLSKSYIIENQQLINSNDKVMNKFLSRIKFINNFRFIVYWIIGPFILLVVFSIIANIAL